MQHYSLLTRLLDIKPILWLTCTLRVIMMKLVASRSDLNSKHQILNTLTATWLTYPHYLLQTDLKIQFFQLLRQ